MLRKRDPSPARTASTWLSWGAGIAGLAAARTLAEKGYSTVILEAADRPGGRIRTDRSLGAPVDLGASWIHGPDGNPISDLVSATGDPVYATDESNLQLFDERGVPQPDQAIETAEERLQRIYRALDRDLETDEALSAAIARLSRKEVADPVLRWMTSAYTEFSSGGPLGTVSALYFDEDHGFDGEDVILPGGYDRVVEFLARGVDIRLETPVSRIEYAEGHGVDVHTAEGRFAADFVVCTIPLGMLQQGSVQFDPPLPDAYTDGINRIGMGSVTKLALKFAEPFWNVDIQQFGLMTERLGRWNTFLNYRTFSAENILLGFCVGGYARIADAMDDEAMVADGMDALRSMFGPAVPDPVGHVATRWSRDPYTGGAYSYTKVGSEPADFDRLARPVANTVFLAGEHTIFKYHSTVHGAYLSGVRAAQLIDS